jgi:hypothetical protein
MVARRVAVAALSVVMLVAACTDDDWRQLASHFGGAFDNSPNSGKSAYEALLVGGASTFAALLGGLTLYRQLDGEKGYAFAVRCVRD